MGTGRISTAAGALALVAVLPLAAACGESNGGGDGADVEAGRPDDFEATPDYLAAAIDDSQGLPHRFEVGMKIQVGDVSVGGDEPMTTGAFDGERTQMAMDARPLYEDMGVADEFGDADLSMELVSDGSTSFIRAPIFAALADQLPPGADTDQLGPQAVMIDLFDDIGDGWAKVDLTAVGDLPQKLANLVGAGQTMDPSVFLDIVRGTHDVEELGTDNIGLDGVTGLAAEVSLVEMLDAQGVDLDEFFDDVPAEMAQHLDDFRFDVEVWIDGEARVRQVVVDMGDALARLAEEADEELPDGGLDFSTTIDFFDYGDESIAVDVPTEDAIDITQELLVLVEEMDD